MDNNTKLNPEDLTLDDLFNDDPDSSFAPAEEPQDPPTAPTEPQAPVQSEPYLRTSTGTVYEREEDAVRGTEEKDRQIETLRQTFITMHGYDPITGKPVRLTPQTEEVNYARDAEKFYADIGEANSKRDAKAFASIMQKFMYDTYGPVMTQSAKSLALANLERQIPGIQEFVESDKYKSYLSARPVLQDAIAAAERDPAASVYLTDLYLLAHEGASGKSLPEVLKSAREASPPQTQTQGQAPKGRPTLQPTHQPAATEPSQVADLTSPEGRKAIIERGRQSGLDKKILF